MGVDVVVPSRACHKAVYTINRNKCCDKISDSGIVNPGGKQIMTEPTETTTSYGDQVHPKLSATAREAKAVAVSILSRIVSDEWQAIEEARRDGTFPEMVRAYVAGRDTEYFNMTFPHLAGSGILAGVVDTYIQRIMARPGPTVPVDKPERSDNTEAMQAAFKQYMALKGPPRLPRPIISGAVERVDQEGTR
jgi:hypothetical protein